MTTTVFVDMDGVLADFDGYFKELFKQEFRQYRYDDRWDLVAAYPTFFRDLPLMPGATEWWGGIRSFCEEEGYRLAVLTSLPHNNMEAVAFQKMAWIRNTLNDPDVMVLFSRGGTRKSMFVQAPGDILIDDKQLNIVAWEAQGGCGILFKPGLSLAHC